MTQLAQQAKKQCPNTKIVLSGYSQGGIVVHNAAKTLSGTPLAGGKIGYDQIPILSSHVTDTSPAVLFGDPYNKQPVAGVPADKLKQFCASGDTICARRRQLGGGHLSYGANANEAADFIVAL